ncbi:hypothetical protein PR002_g16863 [Phytophthora rubi]|uniref:Uncharacterized protein n=1 Tax=Phytophthora rubi TaxID=129364 RepID=A0A6A3KEX4_9STRA|nr:hypothetical protein PR002_g16863 [Phytophthora rubi]
MSRRSPRLSAAAPRRAAGAQPPAVAHGGRSPRTPRRAAGAHATAVAPDDGTAPSVSHRHVEPDAEPTPVEPDVADLSDPPHAAPTGPSPLPAGPLAGLPFGGKPKRKDLPIASFSGRTQPHGFDSGVHAFRKRFLKELVTVQLLDGHRFTEQQCLALFILCLDGDASVYMNNVQLRQPDLTLDQAGALLGNRFSSMLPTSTILDIIRASTKGATETYQQFAARLLGMAEALPGGTEVETNASVVLETFVEKAYWRFSAQLGGFS